jgi:hypothetical protein
MEHEVTLQTIRLAFERIEQDAARRDSAFERRALRNYLLHTLLAAAGRYDELFEYDTATADPDYVFFDTGRRIQGRDAIARFHREQAATVVPLEQRVAMSDWGFAAEQTMLELRSDGSAQRTKSALVWRCDAKGRVKSLRFYPAAQHEDVRMSTPLPDAAAVARELAPLIERVRKT